MKFYKSLTTLPIYNNWMLAKSGDLRYLVMDSREGDLPEIDSATDFELKQIYSNLVMSKDEVEMRPVAFYARALQALLKYEKSKEKSKKEERLVNSEFGLYMDALQKTFSVKQVEGIEGQSIQDIYRQWRLNKLAQNSNFNLYYERLMSFDYTKLEIEQKHEYDLYKDVLFVSQTLNLAIDEFTMSVAKFDRFRNEAIRIATKLKQSKASKHGSR